MELRPELMPPALDEAKLRHLAELVSRLDGAYPGLWVDDLVEFNRVAGTAFTIEDFQGIYGAEDHETWVRRLLVRDTVRPAPDVTRAQLAEIIRRAMPQCGYPDFQAYMAVFDANVPLAGASNGVSLSTEQKRTLRLNLLADRAL